MVVISYIDEIRRGGENVKVRISAIYHRDEDDLAVFESGAIPRYLADRNPQALARRTRAVSGPTTSESPW